MLDARDRPFAALGLIGTLYADTRLIDRYVCLVAAEGEELKREGSCYV